MNMQNLLQNRRLMIIGGGGLAILIVLFVIISAIQSAGKTAGIKIESVVPDDITVKIDGAGAPSNGRASVTPGNHTVTATRKGFADQKQTVSVKAGETKTVRFLLTPNGQEGYDWAASHPDQFAEYEATQSQQFDTESQDITQKYPIIGVLPEIRPTWRVDYGQSEKKPNDPNAIEVIITYSGNDIDKQDALDWIVSQGFNLSDYDIVYKTLPNDGD